MSHCLQPPCHPAPIVCPHLPPPLFYFHGFAAAAFEPLANAMDQVEREMYPPAFSSNFQPPTSISRTENRNCQIACRVSRLSPSPPPLSLHWHLPPWPSRNKGRCLFVLHSERNRRVRRTVDLFPCPRPRRCLICKLTVTREKKKIQIFQLKFLTALNLSINQPATPPSLEYFVLQRLPNQTVYTTHSCCSFHWFHTEFDVKHL